MEIEEITTAAFDDLGEGTKLSVIPTIFTPTPNPIANFSHAIFSQSPPKVWFGV